MTHSYYSSDSPERKRYFDKQFMSNAQFLAKSNKISLNSFLKRIKDFESFKDSLELAWSNDTSLTAYFNNMNDSELLEFYNRPIIQSILNKNIGEITEEAPIRVIQVNKKNREFFRAKIKEKLTFAYKQEIVRRKKKIEIYRDSLGRFSRRI